MATSLVPAQERAHALRRKRSFTGSASTAGAIEARLLRLEPGVYAFPAGRGLTEPERADIDVLDDELSDRLLDLLDPDDARFFGGIARQVHASFKVREGGASDQDILDGFALALPGRARPAVLDALRRILQDEAPEEYSRTFAPTPGDLAKLARAIEAEWRLERDRLRNLRAVLELAPPVTEPQPTAQEMAELRERVKRLTAGNATKRPAHAPDKRQSVHELRRQAMQADLDRWEDEAKAKERARAEAEGRAGE